MKLEDVPNDQLIDALLGIVESKRDGYGYPAALAIHRKFPFNTEDLIALAAERLGLLPPATVDGVPLDKNVIGVTPYCSNLLKVWRRHGEGSVSAECWYLAPAGTHFLEEFLTPQEAEFCRRVFAAPGSKLGGLEWNENGSAPWTRPENLLLVKCVGSYKWEPMDRLLVVAQGLSRFDLAPLT